MARWEGNTRGRLVQAALDLFTEQGYDRTTVAQIARRANLTERTFYRWFPDKREVLFGGSDELVDRLVSAIGSTPADTGALPTLLGAFVASREVIRPRAFLKERSKVIESTPPLRERELSKAASMCDALTAALVTRGCDPETARLATEVALAVIRLTSERWLADEQGDMERALASSTADLLALTADAVPGLATARGERSTD
ncbi:TetR family transcriptional regulator [Streptomyces sp. DW26H14]|uniref:TetR family transcriptional regulator n=1 Tax=Streptomyces sp. DW26H14 TaxID=3435395 RepID=UPI00403E12F9